MFVLRLIGVLALIVLNGFFAAAEFSLVAVRISRVRQLVTKGNLRARVVESLVGDLRRVVSGVQLGITLSSLAIGALGESSLAKLFQQIWPGTLGTHSALIAHAVALTVAFALLSALHVVIGELVPKTISLARAERVALLIRGDLQRNYQSAGCYGRTRARRGAFHGGAANSDSAGAGAGPASRGGRKIYCQCH